MKVVCNNIKKYYGDVKAVDGISFEIQPGSFFAIIGENGAGKSTIFDMMLKRIVPSEGDIFIDGINIQEVPLPFFTKIGTVYQDNLLDDALSVFDNLLTRSWLFNDKKSANEKVQVLLLEFDIEYLKNKKYRELSGGERRKVDIICSLLHDPEMLILDEPTTGIDVGARQEIWELLQYLRSSRKLTIILATHYLEEAELADQMIVIRKGKLIAEGTPVELKEKFAVDKLYLYSNNVQLLTSKLKKENLKVENKKTYVEIQLENTIESLDILNQYKDQITAFEVKFGKLDEVFVNLMEVNK